MSKYSFMKESKKDIEALTTEELLEVFSSEKPSKVATIIKRTLLSLVVIVVAVSFVSIKKLNMAGLGGEEVFSMVNSPIAAAVTKKDVISIPSGVVKANPFVPYRPIGEEAKKPVLVNDVPKFDLIAPPETLGGNSEAAKIMDTVVSGILYDKFSPSAILKIDGNDYLVKKGDVVNNYKVVAIAQDSVTVKFGNNTYKAGIGEILTEGTINYNEVSNLSKKFGGEQR